MCADNVLYFDRVSSGGHRIATCNSIVLLFIPVCSARGFLLENEGKKLATLKNPLMNWLYTTSHQYIIKHTFIKMNIYKNFQMSPEFPFLRII